MGLPAFLDHFNARDLKVFFRCWVAAWVACLLFIINPSLRSLGTATFFACMVQFMLPPSGIVSIYLLGSLTLLMGMFLAWGWGVIVMKAALAARPTAETQARYASLQQAAKAQANATGISPVAAAQILIYEGYMLDVRVTVVTYCLVCTFIYLLARLRASNPKATFTAIFGTIISDLFLNYAPLFPSFQGTLPLTLIKPAAIGVGLGFACSVFLFPRSTSHVVLDSLEDMMEHLKLPLKFTASAIGKREEKDDLDHLRLVQSRIIQEYRKMEPAFAFLPLDFSVGYWGARDVEKFKEPTRKLVTAILALLEFHVTRVYSASRNEDILLKYGDKARLQNEMDTKFDHDIGRYQRSQLAEMLDGFRNAGDYHLSGAAIQELVGTGTYATEVCIEALDLLKQCIHMANCRRWFRRPSKEDHKALCRRIYTALEDLRRVRTSFVHDMTETLIANYTSFFEELSFTNETKKQLRDLVISMVFEEHMANAIDKTEALMMQIYTVFHTSNRIRLWWPLSLTRATSWVIGKDSKAPMMTPSADDDPDQASDLIKVAEEKLRISRGYRTKQRNAVGRAILGTYHWFTSNSGLYALRMVIITIALGIPGVIPHTAGFYYRQKGLWGLIMGQTSLLVYMADFTFSVISRVVGTVAGGILGLLAWYIGSAQGPGNPYGLAAIVGAMLLIFVWVRLYLPPSLLQGGIMGGVTFLLVIAYSYDDTHIFQYGSPGVGYAVFYRRMVLVLIGVGAAIIIQVLPRPPSASKHVCKSLSRSIRSLSDHYALLLSCWGHSQDHGKLLAESVSLQLTQSLVGLDDPIALLRFEFSSSRFDSKSLTDVKRLCHSINLNLRRLLVLSGSLPQSFQDHLSRQTGLIDHRIIGEVMAILATCEQVLKTEDSLPEILPSPLVRRAYEYGAGHLGELKINPELVRDEEYRKFCVAFSAYLNFLGSIDELVLVMKDALGEAHLVSKSLADLV
ncbi:hypothetical protein BGW36DRAFT_297410 [Talaromyces proteolyticus]|uniref:ER transporter 6TM N-terminal domain-containing protein n=1 Tax=Talaromyces proteolyticus TaxID=1131652 RepID=A0AAD4KRR6_9EURO|nr:uncharacterized protein BGW36DRAFT_297410 [Talaromyces proteolyticus]KAH8696737.1 hypothetical protein BGW36DRAFT_297410 [Talaromyces proteolyticus]